MKVGEILVNSVLSIDSNQTWTDTLSVGELVLLPHDKLLEYAKKILAEYIQLGYSVREIADYIKFVERNKEL